MQLALVVEEELGRGVVAHEDVLLAIPVEVEDQRAEAESCLHGMDA